ncbi:MAG TPA: hypothetical protein DEP45_11970, partial [Armatimonadetes bacterium]|nr:hypothetical protein [Armatimonadota bacterium]
MPFGTTGESDDDRRLELIPEIGGRSERCAFTAPQEGLLLPPQAAGEAARASLARATASLPA